MVLAAKAAGVPRSSLQASSLAPNLLLTTLKNNQIDSTFIWGRWNDYREFVDPLAGRDRRGRFEREATGEDRQPPEYCALLLCEQIEAPVERRAQRLLARQRSVGSTGEQPEAVIETSTDLLDR